MADSGQGSQLPESRERESVATHTAAGDTNERIRAVVESTAADAIMLVDADETVSYLNPAAEDLFGYRTAEIMGQPLALLVPERFRQGYARQFCDLASTNGGVAGHRTELWARRKDGQEVALEASLSDCSVAGQRFFAAVLKEISVRQREQADHMRSEARYRTLIEHLPQTAVVVFDRNLRFELAAGPALDQVGWRERDVAGKTLPEVVGPEQARRLAPHYRATLHGETRSLEYRSRVDGRRYWMRTVPLYGPDGDVIGGMAVSLDITERMVAEDALRVSEERFRSIFNWAGIGIAHVGLDGKPVEVNAAMERMLGYPEAELRDMALTQLNQPEDAEDARRAFARLAAGDHEYYERQTRIRAKDGSLMLANLTMSLVRDRDGAPRFAIAMIEDFTNRSLAEQKRLSEVSELARTDSLTGLANRRAWEETLPRELAAANRSQRPLCLAMLDLDHFKRFNDQHGHQAGDSLLAETASAWRAQLRLTDTLVRYGGEEFAILLPNCPLREGLALVERLRSVTPSGQTCSAGIAAWDGSEPGDSLLARADEALYDAKRAGRNRTHSAP